MRREAGDPMAPGLSPLLASVGVVDLLIELPVALAVGAGGVDRVDRMIFWLVSPFASNVTSPRIVL